MSFSVCVCVCLSVCLSVFLSVFFVCSDYNFWTPSYRNFILVCRYILTISRSNLSIKIIWSRSRSYEKKDSFTYFNLLILCMWPKIINEVKVKHQGEGHIKVKVKIASSLPTSFKILHILTYLSSVCGQRSLIRSRSNTKVR